MTELPLAGRDAHLDVPSGTVTFLFTDIEGSTKLLERLRGEYATLLADHYAILRSTLEHWHGHEVGTQGDAFFITFSRAADAVCCVMEAQKALAAHIWLQGATVRVRMGLHTGEPIISHANYVGMDVHLAARIASAGHGGQVLLSQTTRDLIYQDLPQGAALRDLGAHQLKDIRLPQQIYQLDIEGLPVEFPPLKTTGSADEPPQPGEPPFKGLLKTNLSVQLTSFIGRVREMAEVKRLLASTRLLTLTGTGGTGKTRLALQVGAELRDEFKDGVFFVALAPLTDPALVVSTVALTLGVSESGGQPLMQTLTDYLQSKQLLLVLDNFEHLLAAAPVVNELLAPASQLKVLVTSRSPLHLSGEREYPVPPLALPDPKHLPALESLSQVAALELFIERAQAVKPDFSLTSRNARAVVEICYRLDGLPLALELAAARVKMLTPEAMLARLASRLKLLTGGARDLPARQQTLRNTIEWSYNLLDASEQQLFRRLALFAGGFTLEAAEAVCNAAADLQLDLFEGSSSLLDKSLLQHSEIRAEPRYAMLETIREFALQSLNASVESDAIRRRHAEYYLMLAESAAPALNGPQQLAWLNRLETELDNLRAALGWALESGEIERGLRAASALWMFWFGRAHWSEGREWLATMLARPEASANTEARAEALFVSGFLANMAGEPDLSLLEASTNLARELGTAGMRVLALSLAVRAYFAVSRDPAEARALADESLSIARQIGDKWVTGNSLNIQGCVLMRVGDYAAAQFSFEESIKLLRVLGDKWLASHPFTNIGLLLYQKGEYPAASGYLEQGLEIMREFGDPRNVAAAMQALGRVVLAQGNYLRAQLMYQQSLTIWRDLGNKSGIMMVLDSFASLAVARGKFESAVRLFGAIEALLAETGGEVEPHHRADFDRNLAAARAQLDEAAFRRAWAEGRAMSMDQAIEYALATPSEPEALAPSARAAAEPGPKEPYPAGLSARELEVLRLVASGLTDAQVAEQLVLSPRTIGTHLQAVYSKLGVNSRMTASRWALEHGLL